MKRSIRLTLKKETLAALDGEDMRSVNGGVSAGPTCYTCPPRCPIIYQRSLIVVTNCCDTVPTFDLCTT